MSEEESASLPCGICHLPFQRLNGSHNLRICLTCSAIFQLNVKPSVRRSLELLRTITVEGSGFVEIDGGEFIVAGVSGLGYRFSVQTPFKMSIECYRSKNAAVNWNDELCLHPCVDLADELEEIPVGDLVFTYAMALTNDVHAAEEIETLEQGIELRDSFAKPPTQEEWNEAVLKIRKRAQQWGFGGPFPIEEEVEGWDEEDPPFFYDFEDDVQEEAVQNEDNQQPIAPELPEWTQDRVDRFLERIHRVRRNNRGRT